ncbi:MAG TPA: type II secretion system protein [Candidatus Paceibacterota bacterium]|nr:type II secretion system protein [Candidatus Paceibacterota bacterium]
MNRYHFRGFTLIELLVVIAIIGILSAVVLASLNTARSKGNDAAMKANLDTIRKQAVIYFNDNGQYAATDLSACSGDLFSDQTVVAAITAAGTSGAVTCFATAGEAGGYAVAGQLKDGSYWCVDSKGVARGAPTAPTGVTCP